MSRQRRSTAGPRPETRIVATVGPASATESVIGRMIRAGVDIFRFNARCRHCLAHSGFDGRSLGEFLASERLGDGFRDHYLLPMAAAIWSCPTDTMLDFPAESLARFFDNHRLLNPLERPAWRSVAGWISRSTSAKRLSPTSVSGRWKTPSGWGSWQ